MPAPNDSSRTDTRHKQKATWVQQGRALATRVVSVIVVLGVLLKHTTGINLLKLLRYLAREFLLIVSTSSSETALPRLIAKMEHLGVSKPVVGIAVPTG